MYHGHNTRWLTGGGRTLRNYLQSQLVLWQGLCILMSINSHRDDYCQSQLLWQCLCLLIDIGMVIHHSPITIHHASGGSFTFLKIMLGVKLLFSQNHVFGCETVFFLKIVLLGVKLSFLKIVLLYSMWNCLFLKIVWLSEVAFSSKFRFRAKLSFSQNRVGEWKNVFFSKTCI